MLEKLTLVAKNPTWFFIVVIVVFVPLTVFAYSEKKAADVSLMVALSALLVAMVSLIYTIKTWDVSRRTLASQKQTEKNTQKVNFAKQCELLLNLRLEILQKLAYIAALNEYIKDSNIKPLPKEHKFCKIKLSETYIYEDSALDRENTDRKESATPQAESMQRIVMDDYICLCSIKEKISNFNNIVANCCTVITDEFEYSENGDLLRDLKGWLFEIVCEILNITCVYDKDIIRSLDNSVCSFTRSDLMTHVPIGEYCIEYEPIITRLFTIDSGHKTKSDYFRLFQYRVFDTSKTIRDWFYPNKLSM